MQEVKTRVQLTGDWLLAAGTLIFCLSTGTPASSQTIENRHVYSLANELADEIELIREVMGRPYDDSPRMPVSGVTNFELYFQAQTLLRKSNQLARELGGAEAIDMGPIPSLDVSAADIYELIQQSLENIRSVRRELGITERVPQDPRETPIAPTGIFSVVLDSNRQLNLLLTSTTRSADVYDELNLAIAYTAGILASRGSAANSREQPFDGYKRPADVYSRILECVDIVARIAMRAGIEVVNLSSRRNVPDDVEPGHVYDLANIVVADIVLLAASLNAEPAPTNQSARPTHIFPSHAYERAGFLKEQLELLESRL